MRKSEMKMLTLIIRMTQSEMQKVRAEMVIIHPTVLIEIGQVVMSTIVYSY